MARLALKVSPKASRNAITGFHGTALKVAVTAAPERGKANEAVEALLAEALGLPRGAVQVVSGQTSRSKQLEIKGLDETAVRERLRTIVEHATRPGR
jgi:uncharacterized protein